MFTRLAVLTALGCLACSRAKPDSQRPAGGVRLERVAGGLDNPLHLTAPVGDSRLFVVEQPGRIRIVKDGRLLETPFLDITDRVRSGGERGLLSVAFHPLYAANGRFFVNYTDRAGDTRVERYVVSADPDLADPRSAALVLTVRQPYANHNGGHVIFGPDGMLYIGMGDGGAGGDPHGHGQNRATLLGTLLRIDVDRGEPYAIPADNPFVGVQGARGEIWAYGLRNPWRIAFDPRARLLYIADVGQNRWEEINVVADSARGVNYGWNVMEGTHCYSLPLCSRRGLTLPVLDYGRSDGCSVIGGYVYRGRALPALVGHYLYSDYCGGWLRSYRYEGGAVRERRDWAVGDIGTVLSFGEDAGGELYILSQNGNVYRIAPAS